MLLAFPARIAALAAAILFAALCVAPAQAAVTMAQCSALYKAAQAAGTLNGMTWNDFRKADCGPNATAAAPAAPVTGTTAKTAKTAKTPKTPAPATASAEPTATNTENAPEPPVSKIAAPKGVVFPTAVSTKYASESAGKARMHTCLDQYKLDKANNGLAGLTWIQAGGGYYSLCNTRLKG
jgi:hypothetical protein